MENQSNQKRIYNGPIPGRSLFDGEDEYYSMDAEDHCCLLMAEFIDDPRVPIEYSAPIRDYYMFLKNSNFVIQSIFYCPMCGKKLPENLVEQYEKILEEEYGIRASLDSHKEAGFPEDFKSDAWWKKRGL